MIRSESRYDPIMFSLIQFEFSPSMAGFLHSFQFSCLQDLPPQKRQCSLVFYSKSTPFTGDFYKNEYVKCLHLKKYQQGRNGAIVLKTVAS